MSEKPDVTRAELMEQIDLSWTALQDALGQFNEEQLTTKKDAAGWAVKDHLLHLARWEGSTLALLQGNSRHEALGVDEALYLSGDEDAINAALFKQGAGLSAQEALAQLRDGHAEMMALLRTLSEADLFKPYGSYVPGRADDGPPVINWVYGNTAHHFAEHLPWIETLANSS